MVNFINKILDYINKTPERKMKVYLSLSFIFLSIFTFYLILEFTYGNTATFEEKLQQNSIVRMLERCEGVRVIPIVSPFTINPFDNYFTFIENCIVWISLFEGMYFWVEWIIVNKSKWKIDKKSINTGSLQYFIIKKIEKWRKNKKTKLVKKTWQKK